jgi:plastocyanin
MRFYRGGPAAAGTALVLSLLLSACAPVEEATVETVATAAVDAMTDDIGTERSTVTFTGTEYEYDGPESIPAGMTEVEFVNEGEFSHMLIFIGFGEEQTLEDVKAELAVDGPPPSWMSFPGGIAGIPGGSSARAVFDFPAGKYALLSFDSADGDDTPDVARGMISELTVTESNLAGAPEPEPDALVSMLDYGYESDDTFSAGEITVEFVNQGKEPHEALVMKLAEGMTAEAFVEMVTSFDEGDEGDDAASDMSTGTPGADGDEPTSEPEEPADDAGTPGEGEEGPPFEGPPVTSRGGFAPIDAGKSGFATLNLEAGRYMFICFFPTPDGTPHMALGMVKEFSVE